MWMLVAGCVTAVLLLYHTVLDLIQVHVYRLPPGPISLPLIGGLHKLSVKYGHMSMCELGKKYGPIFSIRLGPVGRVVVIDDLKHVTQIFESPDCNDRPPLKIFDILSEGRDGIGSCAYGRRWKEMTQAFHKGLAQLSHSSLEDRADHLYKQLFQNISTTKLDQQYYPHEDVYAMSTALIGSLVYGIAPEKLTSADHEELGHELKTIMDYIHPFQPINLFPPLSKLPLPGIKGLINIVNVRMASMQKSYTRHDTDFTGQIHDIMDIIVGYMRDKSASTATDQDDITRDDMLTSSWTMYLAGSRTMADSIIWLVTYLCHYPFLQEAIQKEVAEECPTPGTVLVNRANLNYTRAAIFEILRLSSILAIGVPKCTSKDIKLGEFTIPKGTMLMTNQWKIHHDETLWPEPFQARPERFLDQDGKLLSYQTIFHKMPYLPFSFGKRPCLGKHMGLDLMLIFTVSLLRKYDLRLPKGHVPNLKGELKMNLEPPKHPIIFTER